MLILLFLCAILHAPHLVLGLGSSCSAPLDVGMATPGDPYWLETIAHRGTSPFNPDPSSYQVFRNVKDFGAKGDGATDDTAAINTAMAYGGRCGGTTCSSSSVTPAIVYIPRGTYLVSSAINMLYYTQIIGDAKHPPTLLASPDFSGFAVIDADPYIPDGYGAEWYTNTDNFLRSVRNLVIDLRQMPASAFAYGLHWQVAQATSLINVIVEMSTVAGNNHQGIFMENGSGGFMGDVTFNGGKYGMQLGNQQLTVRNLSVTNANIAVSGLWNWGFTFQGVSINNCSVGFDLATGGTTQSTQKVGAVGIIDTVVKDTPIFIRTSTASNGKLAGSLVLNNIKLNNVPIAVGVQGGEIILSGRTTVIASWGQGNVFSGTNGVGSFTQGNIVSASKSSSLLDAAGRIFGKTHPQYAQYAASQFISVKSQGAKGDGRTDDTAVIQSVLDQYAGCKIIFFDAGVYYISDTITIPPGARIVGEAWSVILAGGNAFQDQSNPRAAVQAGETGSSGVMEISDMIFSTVGPAPGAIVLQWNIHDPFGQQGAAGLWDTHIRLGGAVGTGMQNVQCPSGSVNPDCIAAFLAMHLTPGSSAYVEGTWVWTADHDMDATGSPKTSVFSGRGILSESAGPVWLVGTASEHATLYQYNLANSKDHWIGFVQTESPYNQPAPAAPSPFSTSLEYHDPTFSTGGDSAWAMVVQNSNGIILFGAGFYSFFRDYDQTCVNTMRCQSQGFNIDSTSTITVYSLSTVGIEYQLSVLGEGVVNAASNPDGFQATLTAWSR